MARQIKVHRSPDGRLYVKGSGFRFTPLTTAVVVQTQNSTHGDGTYDTAQSIDFSSAVPSSAVAVLMQVTIAADAASDVAPGIGFRYTPTGFATYLEWYTLDVKDATIDEKMWMEFPLASDLTGTMAVVKIDNGVGDAWSYEFKAVAYR